MTHTLYQRAIDAYWRRMPTDGLTLPDIKAALGENRQAATLAEAMALFGPGSLSVGDQITVLDDGTGQARSYEVTAAGDGSWSGSVKREQSSSTIGSAAETFTPTAGQTVFPLSAPPSGTPLFSVNGAGYEPGLDFTWSDSAATWLNRGFTLDDEDIVSIRYLTNT